MDGLLTESAWGCPSDFYICVYWNDYALFALTHTSFRKVYKRRLLLRYLL